MNFLQIQICYDRTRQMGKHLLLGEINGNWLGNGSTGDARIPTGDQDTSDQG